MSSDRPVLQRALVVAAFAGGCSFGPDPEPWSPPNQQRLGDGRIAIAWTLGGQPPGVVSCDGIAGLDLELHYGGLSTVRVTPIPCTLTRFRYDHLPTGQAQAVLTARDADNCVVATGTASLRVSETLPEPPSPTVSIAAPRRCR